MLSKTGKYSIRAVLYLTLFSEKGKKSPAEIAKAIDVPVAFLAKNLQALSRKGIVSSVKGRNGGFYLSEENRKKTILDILGALGELEKFHECFIGLPACGDDKPCPVHAIIKPLRNKILMEMNEKTVEDFADGMKEGSSFIFLE